MAISGRSLATPAIRVRAGNIAQSAGHENEFLPCLFILSPVKNGRNEIIAVLILAINPLPSLDRLTRLTAFDVTGETSIFDQYGHMFTSSRFEDQLRQIGLVQPDESSAGSIAVRDPGGDGLELTPGAFLALVQHLEGRFLRSLPGGSH